MNLIAWGETAERIRKVVGVRRSCPIYTYNNNLPPEYVSMGYDGPYVAVGEGWIRNNYTEWYDVDKSQYETVVIQKKEIPRALAKSSRTVIPYMARYSIGSVYGVIVRRKGETYHHGVPLDILKKRRRIEEHFPRMDVIQWVRLHCNESFADVLDAWCNERYYASGVPTGLGYVIVAAFRTFCTVAAIIQAPSLYYASAIYENGSWIHWWGKPLYTPIGRIDVYENAIFVDGKLLPTKLYPYLWCCPELVRLRLAEL